MTVKGKENGGIRTWFTFWTVRGATHWIKEDDEREEDLKDEDLNDEEQENE